MIFAKDVLAFVAKEAGVSAADLIGPNRKKALTHIRFIAVWVIRQRCPHMSYPAVGRLLGGRDHTTIIHASKRAEEEMAKQPRLQQIAMDAIARFATSELESLDHAIALASAELDALKATRDAHLNAGTVALFERAA